MSPGPVHRSGAATRFGPGLLLYFRSPGTPPPRACHHRDTRRHSPGHTSTREAKPGWHDRGSIAIANLGGGRLGGAGCWVTVSKGGGPAPAIPEHSVQQPARGTWRSPSTPPPEPSRGQHRTRERPQRVDSCRSARNGRMSAPALKLTSMTRQAKRWPERRPHTGLKAWARASAPSPSRALAPITTSGPQRRARAARGASPRGKGARLQAHTAAFSAAKSAKRRGAWPVRRSTSGLMPDAQPCLYTWFRLMK